MYLSGNSIYGGSSQEFEFVVKSSTMNVSYAQNKWYSEVTTNAGHDCNSKAAMMAVACRGHNFPRITRERILQGQTLHNLTLITALTKSQREAPQMACQAKVNKEVSFNPTEKAMLQRSLPTGRCDAVPNCTLSLVKQRWVCECEIHTLWMCICFFHLNLFSFLSTKSEFVK